MTKVLEFPVSRGIIPALDADSFNENRRIVAATTGIEGIAGYKLGLSSVLRLGLARAVKVLREETDLPLIYDHQKAGPDVPSMAPKFIDLCAESDVQAVILFPLAGEQAVKSFVSGALDCNILPIVGGELPFLEYRASHGGYVVDDVLERILTLAIALGAQHFVLPANDPKRLAEHVQTLRRNIVSASLFLPGIGALGGNIRDTFATVGDWPAYAIIGRAICDADHPSEAARRLSGEAIATL